MLELVLPKLVDRLVTVPGLGQRLIPGLAQHLVAAVGSNWDDASLDLFTRKSPRTWRDLSEKRASKRALSARCTPFFVDGGIIN